MSWTADWREVDARFDSALARSELRHRLSDRRMTRLRPCCIDDACSPFRPAARRRPAAPRGGARSTRRTAPVELPAFMPVGTQGTVKGLEIEQLRATGAQMVLANTYHLALRPGEEVVARAGRAAPLHGLGRTDPDRQRRLPALQPGPIDRSHRGAGRLPLAHRRPPAGAFARAGRRHPGGPGQRRGDGAGSRGRRCPTTAEVRRATPPSGPSAGPGAAATPPRRADQALFAIVQGGLDPRAARRLCPAAGRRWTLPATPSAG